ncbi:hypothetical protein [Paraburkholderia madseniana]|uniref:hypothetical protein n=1 Tax=Paraburkholderia madseniana TaxID=2599607 RepID=UPI0018EC43F6|nr:hypothetical protein [Paraburkholderia madseniana]
MSKAQISPAAIVTLSGRTIHGLVRSRPARSRTRVPSATARHQHVLNMIMPLAQHGVVAGPADAALTQE